MRVDYTKYAPGNAVSSAGIIALCRECHRPGELRDGGARYEYRCVHRARAEVAATREGKPRFGVNKVVIEDECKVTRKKAEAAAEAGMAFLLWVLGFNPRLAVDMDELRKERAR